MKAAVVTAFDAPPRYLDFPAPIAAVETDLVVDVLAVGLHPRVRSQASGSHYTSTDELPLVPGVDGVGRAADGTLRYFVLPDTTFGSMAEQTVIDERRSVVLPADSDVHALAAAMNPAMSSWIALRRRTTFAAGQRVMIMGATGNAGQLAVQVAREFGASEIVAAGRDAAKLARARELGATSTVVLDGSERARRELAVHGSRADVVIDYLWGQPTADALATIVPARDDDGQDLTWIQIGSMAGLTAPIPSAALRACRLQIIGSGQGSVGPREIVAELPALAEAITSGTFSIGVQTMALADVEAAWAQAPTSTGRIVLTP